ncbi:MAG: WW domain-containing protein [Candidatus Thalassarchaeaceae archaeon]|tara:strand:- start:312 stop:1040 length:729 start_codon:yes stop_codon:yes gene_type:complete
MKPDPVPGYSIHESNTGDYYYVNKRTGESQWERPPPDHTQSPHPPMPTPVGQTLPSISGSMPTLFNNQIEEERVPNLMVAKGAIALIIVSIFLPYVSLGGLVEVTGLDIIVDTIEFLDAISEVDAEEFEDSGSGSADSGEGVDVPFRYFMLVIGGIMILFSPWFFVLSAIISSVVVFSGQKTPKIMGWIHLGFFITMFLMLAIGETVLDEWAGDLGFSIIDLLGIGIWLGGLSSIGLIYENS